MQSQCAHLRGKCCDDATPAGWGGGPAGCPPLILTNGAGANFLDSTRGSLHAAHHITARGEAQNAPDRWNPRDAPSVSLSPADLPQEQTTRWCDGPGRPHPKPGRGRHLTRVLEDTGGPGGRLPSAFNRDRLAHQDTQHEPELVGSELLMPAAVDNSEPSRHAAVDDILSPADDASPRQTPSRACPCSAMSTASEGASGGA